MKFVAKVYIYRMSRKAGAKRFSIKRCCQQVECELYIKINTHMPKNSSVVSRMLTSQISVCVTLLLLLVAFSSPAKNKKASKKIQKTGYHTGAYRNLFL